MHILKYTCFDKKSWVFLGIRRNQGSSAHDVGRCHVGPRTVGPTSQPLKVRGSPPLPKRKTNTHAHEKKWYCLFLPTMSFQSHWMLIFKMFSPGVECPFHSICQLVKTAHFVCIPDLFMYDFGVANKLFLFIPEKTFLFVKQLAS